MQGCCVLAGRLPLLEEHSQVGSKYHATILQRHVNSLRMHSSLQQGGINQVHDIEDLVGIGREVKGCAYFASRALAETAQIIICPYNYVVDPLIRSAMQIDIKG